MKTASVSGGVLGLLPADQVIAGEEARAWSDDIETEAVVFPASVEEVRALVRIAGETGARLLPAGRGSWLGAGGWTGGGGVVVSTQRLNLVHDYEPADLTLTAGAGLGWGEVDDLLRRNRQWLPLDPPGVGAGSLGGVVAGGVSGPLQARYGGARDNVLGLEVVTGDGRVLRIGGRVVKNVAGYDLVRLFTGSRGSLGVITSVSVRLFSRPDADVTLFFEEGEVMERAVRTTALPIAAAEVVDVPGVSGEVRTGLAVRVLGGREEVEDVASRLVDEIGVVPRGEMWGGESETFHRRRADWEAGSTLVVRFAALPDRLEATLARARRVGAGVGGEVSADVLGGLVRVKASPPAEGFVVLAEKLGRTRLEVEAAGGTMTLSQAPPDLAARVGWTGDPGRGGVLMRRIKSLFDPASILTGGCP